MAATVPFEVKLWMSTPAGGPIEVGTITVDAHVDLAGDGLSVRLDDEILKHELALALHMAAWSIDPANT